MRDFPDYRLKQIKRAVYGKGIADWKKVTPLPEEIRNYLSKKISLEIPVEKIFRSNDGNTVKVVFLFEDDLKVEGVLMNDGNKKTVCASTQIGCPLNCSFCATGKMDFERNLNYFEILNQILFFKRRYDKIENVVFMGMGEPFLNYENVIRATEILIQKESFNIGARKISISTAGLPDKIKKFANEESQINLAISLHAADDKTRTKLMPINRKYPLKKLFSAVDYYIEKTNRKVMFEYILFDNINDRKSDVDKLTSLLGDRIHYINLMHYNPTNGLPGAPKKSLQNFRDKLEARGLNVGIRKSFGKEIEAGCGQLVTDIKNEQ